MQGKSSDSSGKRRCSAGGASVRTKPQHMEEKLLLISEKTIALPHHQHAIHYILPINHPKKIKE